jgi:hypothetical protein
MGGVGSIGRLSVLKGVGYLTILGEAGKRSKIMAYKCASGGKRPSSALYYTR